MLVTSIFSHSHTVFWSFILQSRLNIGLCSKDQPITRQQILHSSKLKEFADDNFKSDINGRKFSKWVENTVGNWEILFFPAVLSKDLYCKQVKARACLEKG